MALVALLFVALLASGCGRATMRPEQATHVALDAFKSAGVKATRGAVTEDVTVDRAIDGKFIQVHQVEMIADGRSYLVGVSRTLGGVVRLVEPADTELSHAQVTAIAKYRSNPAEDEARQRRQVIAPVVTLVAMAALVAFFRRQRRKSERAAKFSADEISLA